MRLGLIAAVVLLLVGCNRQVEAENATMPIEAQPARDQAFTNVALIRRAVLSPEGANRWYHCKFSVEVEGIRYATFLSQEHVSTDGGAFTKCIAFDDNTRVSVIRTPSGNHFWAYGRVRGPLT